MSRVEGRTTIGVDDLKSWLRTKIMQLEEELQMYKSLLAVIDGTLPLSPPMPGEKIEDLKVGKKRIASIYRGEGYVRGAPRFKTFVTDEVKSYIEGVISEIREMQGGDSEAHYEIKENPDGSLREIRVEGLQSTVEELRVAGALKYVLQTLYYQYKALIKNKGSA
ncbi:MAG: hypothetical protein LRS47_03315 [Desulfurococcales archaeon]|nr:hypothetical protein [Desulfurococcales archaeon]